MDERRQDRRERRTKAALSAALIALMRDKSISRITVSELCACADVNRGTFYAHYEDVYDLLRQIENGLAAEIETALDRIPAGFCGEATTYHVVLEILQCIKKNSSLCTVLLGGHGHGDFMEVIVRIARERCMTAWEKLADGQGAAMLGYVYSFAALGSIGLIRAWLVDGMRETPEALAALIDRLTRGGMSSMMEELRK